MLMRCQMKSIKFCWSSIYPPHPNPSPLFWTPHTKFYHHSPISTNIYQICLDNCSIHQLLQLQISQVVPHHHLQHCEKFSIGDVAILINIIDLERKSKFMLLLCSIEWGKTLIVMMVPDRNSVNDIFPSLFLSKMEMTRLTRGFWLSSGTLKISSGSRSPELS